MSEPSSIALDVTVREARSTDDAAVGNLLVNAFLAAHARKLPEVVYDEGRLAQLRAVALQRRAGAVLVAELEGNVVGTVTLLPPGAPGTQAWRADAADLRHLATLPEYHGQGLSEPLMDAAETLARAWRVPAVCLHVRREATGVSRMYKARGYVRERAGDLDKLPLVFLEGYVRLLEG